MTGESLEINFSYINWSVTMELRKQIRTYNSPGFLGSCKEVEPGTFSPSFHPQPVFVGKDHGFHVSALIHAFLKGCLIHSYSSPQVMSSQTDKGHAKGGKAQQKTSNGGGKSSSQQEKKKDVKQEKDPTTTVVTWKVPTHWQREPEDGEIRAPLEGQQGMDESVDLDVLALELVMSQSHGDIITNTLIISNIVTEGVTNEGKPRVKLEQLHYLISGALAPYGFEATSEGVKKSWEKLCISNYITTVRQDNLRAWTFYELQQEARFSPFGSSEGHEDPKDPDPYRVQHRPFLLVSRLWNWQDGKWDWIGQGELQQIYEPLVVQAVPPLFTQINPQYWNIDQLTWRNVPSDIPGNAANAVLAMLNSSMAEVTKTGFSESFDWWNLVVATERESKKTRTGVKKFSKRKS